MNDSGERLSRPLLLIGCGKMGGAMLSGWLESGIAGGGVAVLDPMGLDGSAFQPSDAIRSRLARAIMWSYDGRSFPAPTFELGMAPAGTCRCRLVVSKTRMLSVVLVYLVPT